MGKRRPWQKDLLEPVGALRMWSGVGLSGRFLRLSGADMQGKMKKKEFAANARKEGKLHDFTEDIETLLEGKGH